MIFLLTMKSVQAYGVTMNKRLIIDLPEDLHRRFRHVSFDLDRHMKDIVVEYIERFVEEHEKGQEKEAKRH